MKKITIQLLLLILVFINVQCTGSSPDEKTKDFESAEDVKVASDNDGKIVFTIDHDELINTINEDFSNDTIKYTAAEIKEGVTIGDKKMKFYYMQFQSNRGSQMVRYLVKEKNDLYFKQSVKNENDYLSFYVACNGVEGCVPNLYSSEEGLDWICGDKPECVRPTKENFCIKTVSLAD